VMGGDGDDFTNGGANINETFAGEGDDFVIAGQGEDAVFGDSGDDWEEGGDQPDLLQGDSGNLFFLDNSNKPGHDILVGQGGDDDYDMEGGDDLGVGGPGIEKVAGASGFDWEIGLNDPQPQNQDLDLPLVGIDVLTTDVRDRFNEVEALSGWDHDDVLRGDDAVPATVGGLGFIGNDSLTAASLERISGLESLVGPLAGTATWGEGNILLGGAGDDLIEGRGANDVIDGDAWLRVQLKAPDLSTAAPDDAMLVDGMTVDPDGAGPQHSLQEDVFAGRLNPGDITAVRSIQTTTMGNDTAVFTNTPADYTFTPNADNSVTVTDNAGDDGTDTLRNIEQVVFRGGTPNDPTDDTAPAALPAPADSVGDVTIAAPAVGTVTLEALPAPTNVEATCELLLPQSPVVRPAATGTGTGVPAGTAAPGIAVTPQVSGALSRSAVNVGTKVSLRGTVAPFKGVTLTLTKQVGKAAPKVAATKLIPLNATTGAYSFRLSTKASGKATYSVAVSGPGVVRTVGARRTLSVYKAAIASVSARGQEFVAIRNTGKVAFNLRGWKLRDRSGHVLVLPAKAVPVKATVRIYTGTGKATQARVFLKKRTDIWGTHDTSRLIDRNGVRVSLRRY
jgi:hypothetical protein